MQPVDLTAVRAIHAELRGAWVPARFEQAYQRDRYTIAIALRTFEGRRWLDLAWHPQAARIAQAEPPPRGPDGYSFSDQLRHQLGGLALTAVELLDPWERVLDLQFARRPGEVPLWHLYVEIMGKYSNVILTDADRRIVTAAHQVSERQSSVRPIQTGRPYVHPPSMRGPLPDLKEPFEDWRDRIILIPGPLKKMMVKVYSGLSSAVASQLMLAVGLSLNIETTELDDTDWHRLFETWHHWLSCLAEESFSPVWQAFSPKTDIPSGYSVLGHLLSKDITQPAKTVQVLLDDYYSHQFNREEFRRLHHQLAQKLKIRLAKLGQKAATFTQRLQQSDRAERYRLQADLLMANLPQWQAGMCEISLTDFETGEPVRLSLNPEKNGVQNAQALYKQHQKLKRARAAVMPLLTAVQLEIDYLEQVEESLLQVPAYRAEADLRSLEEIRNELIVQGYLKDPQNRLLKPANQRAQQQASKSQPQSLTNFHRYTTPQGPEVLVGRNNSQNEQLAFKQASAYDLWFHAQEIPGSHVLLRLDAGMVPSDDTLQIAANLAAYYSRGRQSDRVPVVYTEPQNVYKPKGALPGMVIYKRERVLWGQPQHAQIFIDGFDSAIAQATSASSGK